MSAAQRLPGEEPERAWRPELDPHHVLAVGQPHRPDARAGEVVLQLVRVGGHLLRLAGRVTGHRQVGGTQRDAGAGTRGAVTERHYGQPPLRRQLRQCQQKPRIDLAGPELLAGGRRRRDPRVLQQSDLAGFPLREVLAQRGGIGGGALGVDKPDGNLPAPGAEAGEAGRGVGGEELRPHHFGNRRRHHDEAGTQYARSAWHITLSHEIGLARLTWLATQAAAASRTSAAAPGAALPLGPVVGATACPVCAGRLSRNASDPARASTSARATTTLTPRRRLRV